MKYFPLVWSSLMRRRARTFFTMASVAVAFLLFGLLDSVHAAFIDVSDTAVGASQLITMSKMGLGNTLPAGLQFQIEKIHGVTGVSRMDFFSAYYQTPDNQLGGQAVGKNYFAVNDTFVLPSAQLKAFQTTRNGMLVDASTAKEFGWKIGDQVPVVATALPKKSGSNAWTFNVVGIFHARKADKSTIDSGLDVFVRWKYVDTARAFGNGTVNWYQVKLASPALADRVASTIDAISTNSDHETATQTFNAFIASLVNQTLAIGQIMAGIMAAVFFTLILLTGNTMAQAVRERIPELAVLKTIGFRGRTIVGLVVTESVLLIATGGTFGMLIATVVIRVASMSVTMPTDGVSGQTWEAAMMLMLLTSLIVGILPAVRGMRIRIVDAIGSR